MMVLGGSGVKFHSFLTPTIESVGWSASHAGHFTPGGKSTFYPLNRSLAVSQAQAGCCGEETKLLLLFRVNHDSYDVQPEY